MHRFFDVQDPIDTASTRECGIAIALSHEGGDRGLTLASQVTTETQDTHG
jgi:hypothetical protein